MEPLSETPWDVVISGTGLEQSLLALALSRSDKKVLHVDGNEHYGGAEAALSLQDADAWVTKIGQGLSQSVFRDASVTTPEVSLDASKTRPKLSFSRAYSLTLSPQLIYARSPLLSILVSSKVYQQLEFQAIGSWWVYQVGTSEAADFSPRGMLKKVPNGREDVFTDKSIDLKSKRALMRFLKFVGNYENQGEIWEAWADKPFVEFLLAQFGLPVALHPPLLAISMTCDRPENASTATVLPSIARHLRSIGVFGPGFGAVVPKWGGGSEIAQVGCRAAAVGGAIYMLGRSIDALSPTEVDGNGHTRWRVSLGDEEIVTTQWIVGSPVDVPESFPAHASRETSNDRTFFKSITVVSGTLASLLPSTAEGAPPSAGAVIVFPSDSVGKAFSHAPVHVILHTSDTGECPAGQSVMYASVLAEDGTEPDILGTAISTLLGSVPDESEHEILYSVRYKQLSPAQAALPSSPPSSSTQAQYHLTSLPSAEPVFDDGMIERVKALWGKIVSERGDGEGVDDATFMTFEDRQAIGGGGDDDDDNDGMEG